MVIIQFALFTIQLKDLAERLKMSAVQTAPPKVYVKNRDKVGRPSTAAKIAITKTKINEFFLAAGGQQLR